MSTPVISVELEFKIKQWRQKAVDGTLTLDEMKEAILALRAGRLSAMEAAGKSASSPAGKKKKAVVNAQDLLDGI